MYACFFFYLFLCPGLLPPQVLGQSSGGEKINGFLQVVCEEIPRPTHFISGETVASNLTKDLRC